MIKKIAILTSGGDAPGMNTVIKAVVNTALNCNITPFIVREGYFGLYQNMIEEVKKSDVKDIDTKGGTYIFSARFKEFDSNEKRKKAIDNLNKRGIDALIVIGGDGSFKGASQLSNMGLKTIGIPGTIDGDIAFNDFTIGFPTALDTIVQAIDQIRDTMTSHHRIGLIEVMGRDCGMLALYAALACNVDILSVPENKLSEAEIVKQANEKIKSGRKELIILVTEHLYNISELSKKIENDTGVLTRSTILGHIQRGGKPSAFERFNAYRMGSFAIRELMKNKTGIAVSIYNNKVISTDINKIVNSKNKISEDIFESFEMTKY